MQELPGDGPGRDAVVCRLASPHGVGGVGPPVHHADAGAPEKKLAELTLDRTVRLLRSAFKARELSLETAIALVEYHVRRNKVAKGSHDRAWNAKHEGVKFLLL